MTNYNSKPQAHQKPTWPRGPARAYTTRRTHYRMTASTVRRLVEAFLIKGGWVVCQPDEVIGTGVNRARDKRSPDWGYVRRRQEGRGRRRYLRLEVACAFDGCRRSMTAKGKEAGDAERQAWEAGWYFVDDVALCRQHKPGREDGRWRKGQQLHQRETGETYRVVRYLGKGSLPQSQNPGSWPELWCLDVLGEEKVFVFWKNMVPAALAILPGPRDNTMGGGRKENLPEALW